MKNFLTSMTGAAVLLVAGCQNLPPGGEISPTECPTVEPVECPVCAVQECPEPQVVEKLVTKYMPNPEVAANDGSPTFVGAVEWAFIEPGGLSYEARVDTGAETSSIHAENIQLLEKDGKRYVSFTLEHPETKEKTLIERRLRRKVRIKQYADAPADRRYVVRMWVTMGNERTLLDVSLSDRDDFEYPLLLGRNMLMDEFIVDVSKHHTQPKKRPDSN